LVHKIFSLIIHFSLLQVSIHHTRYTSLDNRFPTDSGRYQETWLTPSLSAYRPMSIFFCRPARLEPTTTPTPYHFKPCCF